MTLPELYAQLETLTPLVFYQEHPDEIQPPYIAYFEDDADSLYADCLVVATIQHIEIHLVTIQRDLQTEAEIEALLDGLQLPWRRDTDYDNSQRIFDTIYSFSLIEGREF